MKQGKQKQFSEAFSVSNDSPRKKNLEEKIGAFVDLEGEVSGVSVKNYIPHTLISSKKKKSLRKIIIGSLISLGLLTSTSLRYIDEISSEYFGNGSNIVDFESSEFNDILGKECKGILDLEKKMFTCKIINQKIDIVYKNKRIRDDYASFPEKKMILKEEDLEVYLKSIEDFGIILPPYPFSLINQPKLLIQRKGEKKPDEIKLKTEEGAKHLADLLIKYNMIIKENSSFCSKVENDELWSKGKGRAKHLDFDGDGKSDLVNYSYGTWKLDLSSVISKGEEKRRVGSNTTIKGQFVSNKNNDNENIFGEWDIQLNSPILKGKWKWPYVQDMDADGREDFVVYEKDTGKWYIKFTRWSLLNSKGWGEWDWIISTGVGEACKDNMMLDPKKSIYGRPLPGDYNNDGWVDLAVVCSDGMWRIDYGGPNCSDYGQVDEKIKFLDEKLLALAPGWAYIPILDEVPNGRILMAYKIPDYLPREIKKGNAITWDYEESKKNGTGKIVTIRVLNGKGTDLWPQEFGGNEIIILSGRHASILSDALSLKNSIGEWKLFDANNQWIDCNPKKFGDERCFPVLADFDGDGIDDKAVSCPHEWRIVYSGQDMPHDQDGMKRIPLGYDTTYFSLPGSVFFGGASYYQVSQLIDVFKELYPKNPPPIPVDMLTFSGDYHALFPLPHEEMSRERFNLSPVEVK